MGRRRGEERSISRVGRWVGWVTGERPPGELEGKGMRGEGHAEKNDLDGFGFFVVGLNWIGRYKFCFEFGLDWVCFSWTFC